jgi:hypothetical protein
MARDAQADGRADHPDLISIPRITIELDPWADGGHVRWNQLALRLRIVLGRAGDPAMRSA